MTAEDACAGRDEQEEHAHAVRLLERLKEEVAAGAEIQASLLPPKIPRIPGYDIFSFYRSATELGGALYDFFPFDHERLGFLVANASATGVPGAMVMAIMRTLVRMLAPMCGSGAETLRKTNSQLARDIKRGMSVTAILAELNVQSREMAVSSAGRAPAIIFRESTGELEFPGEGEIPLGVDRGEAFDEALSEERISLESGDRVVLYNDGITEVRNPQNEEYEAERLHGLVREHARTGSKDFVRDLVHQLDTRKGDTEQDSDWVISTFRVNP
jgi:sigma-B regulation protein RsbU (phosphoserine phosphatase)